MTRRSGWLFLGVLCVLEACGGGAGSTAPPVAPPSGLSYSSPQTYYVGTAIQNLAPTVTGTVTSYSVSPPLPAGLTLNTNSGVISGTPTAAAATETYTVTARNGAGQTTFGLSMLVHAGVANVVSGPISRSVVIGSSVSVVVSIQVGGSVPGPLYATAVDSTGVFVPTVVVTSAGGGAYELELATSASAAEGTHSASVTLNLCQDAACQTSAGVPSITVPFTVSVMVPGLAWPGNHITTLSPWPDAPDWAMFQGNAAHTGYVPVTLDPDRFSTRWLKAAAPPYPDSSYLYRMQNSVVISGGRVLSAEAKKLIARSETDGSVAWQQDFSAVENSTTNPPAVAGSIVYMAGGSQASTYFYGFNAADGAPLFASRMGSQWEHYLSPTVGASGVYTNSGYYGGLYGFDPAGTELFFVGEDQVDLWTPAVDASGVYSYTGGILQVVDPSSGAVLHSIADPTFEYDMGEIDGSPVLGAPGIVFVANYSRALYGPGWLSNQLLAFDVPHGTLKWHVSGNYVSTPAYKTGVVYAANVTPLRLEARSEASGSLLWSWTPPLTTDTRFASEILATGNVVFVCTNIALYAIDLDSHKTIWSYPVSGRLALSAQGVLYVAALDRLAAFNVK